jgi:hypothetical protein
MMVARWSGVGIAACLVAAGGSIDSPTASVAQAAPLGAKFVPHEPLRVLDSRTGVGIPVHKLAAGETLTLQFDAASGVSADATAVALNLTVTESDAAAFISAWPTGTQRPIVSNLNLTGAGQTVGELRDRAAGRRPFGQFLHVCRGAPRGGLLGFLGACRFDR